MVHIGNEWDELLKDEFQKEYYLKLREFLKQEYSSRRIYPGMYDIFNALKYTPLSAVKAVILGQDPYQGYAGARLCFSGKAGSGATALTENIYKEIEDDLGIRPPAHGELTAWAQDGVLLLNTVLTVREGCANSHRGMGWEIFTDRVIQIVNEQAKPTVFLLWGANAPGEARAYY